MIGLHSSNIATSEYLEYMEPFKNARGEQAALRAATQSSIMSPEEVVRASGPLNANNKNRSRVFRFLQSCCLFLCMPLLWLLDCFLYLMGEYVCRCCNRFFQATKRQANLCLNGKQPWVCSMRITCVNIVVLCSTWYMFSDQIRLAFFGAAADSAFAVVNLVVWCILMVELLFEVFIRPDGYQNLIISDKAYAPTTVRYINAFHLVVESVSLFCFIPEFYCLLSDFACDARLEFSFFNAALMGVKGPTSLDFFLGKAFFALIRFRVFGLVRHWKKMWINNTFINMRWKAAHGFFSGSSQKQAFNLQKNNHSPHKAKSEQTEDAKKKESVLTNASNIGTALMVTNSYRVLVMLCAIVGILPALASFSAKTTINLIATEMTEQLQATNLLVRDNSNASCQFLSESIASWVAGLTPSEGRDIISADTDVFLLSLDVTPSYCLEWLYQQAHTTSGSNYILYDVCEFVNLTTDSSREVASSGKGDGMDEETEAFFDRHCDTWKLTAGFTQEEDIANATDIRTGSISVIQSRQKLQNFTIYDSDGNIQGVREEVFRVTAVFNESYAIENA